MIDFIWVSPLCTGVAGCADRSLLLRQVETVRVGESMPAMFSSHSVRLVPAG